MNGPFRTPEDYELFLYTLTEQFPAVQRSTVVFIRHGASLARVAGELYFALGFQLVVRERLLYHRLPLILDWYGYEAWRVRKSYTGTTRNRTRMIHSCKVLTPTTNIFLRISSIIESPLQH
jgi:hypothetical protein